MNDEIVEEIHQIRDQLYEETKDMSTEARKAKTHTASAWVQQRIAECRERKAKETTTVQSNATGR